MTDQSHSPMSQKAYVELVDITTERRDEYSEGEVRAAQAELASRNEKRRHIGLDGMQKLLFGLVFWGVVPWSRARKFKAIGYQQKYVDATRSMYTGMVVYGISITIFILTLV